MRAESRSNACLVLHKKCGFPKLKAKKIEAKIFSMCENLTEEYDNGAEELYTIFAYEKIGEIVVNPAKLDDILKDMKIGNVMWDSSAFDERKVLEDRTITADVEGIKMEKGEFKCKKSFCRSDECYYYQDQTRSMDEGATTYVVCTKCGGRYKF